MKDDFSTHEIISSSAQKRNPPQTSQDAKHILIWSFSKVDDADLVVYAQSLANLIGAKLFQMTSRFTNEAISALSVQAEKLQADLIVYQAIPKQFLKDEANYSATSRLIVKMPTSLLRIQKPRWPIARILLILHDGKQVDTPAVDWTIQLARQTSAHVTIMPLIPPVPLMYGPSIEHKLSAILSDESLMGTNLRRIANQMVNSHIRANFRLRKEPPDQQIRQEAAETEYDLTIIGSNPKHGALQWLCEDMVNALLNWTSGNVLITKPT